MIIMMIGIVFGCIYHILSIYQNIFSPIDYQNILSIMGLPNKRPELLDVGSYPGLPTLCYELPWATHLMS